MVAHGPHCRYEIPANLLFYLLPFRQLRKASFQEEDAPEQEPLVHWFHLTRKSEKFVCCLSYSGLQTQWERSLPDLFLYQCNCTVAPAIREHAHLAALLPLGQQASDYRVLQSPGEHPAADAAARGCLGTKGMTVLRIQGGSAWPLPKDRRGQIWMKESPEIRGWTLPGRTAIPRAAGRFEYLGLRDKCRCLPWPRK